MWSGMGWDGVGCGVGWVGVRWDGSVMCGRLGVGWVGFYQVAEPEGTPAAWFHLSTISVVLFPQQFLPRLMLCVHRLPRLLPSRMSRVPPESVWVMFRVVALPPLPQPRELQCAADRLEEAHKRSVPDHHGRVASVPFVVFLK